MKAADMGVRVETGMRWLIVGHGSVGSALARRLDRKGVRASAYDPSPRIPVTLAEHFAAVASTSDGFDIVISCVVPAAAEQALEAMRPLLNPATLYLEWNTVAPGTKRAIAEAAPCAVVDVALMGTLDDEAASSSMAVSGSGPGKASALLTELGFHVDAAGGNAAMPRSSNLREPRGIRLVPAARLKGLLADAAARVVKEE
jgi:3-hydroxyisobutyrate dehydrogenase-like beta-hydroxyacid dehydrogenase